MRYAVPNWTGITKERHVSTVTTRPMTAEEIAWLNNLKPQVTDSNGKKIPRPTNAYRKPPAPPEPVVKVKRGRKTGKYVDQYPHITKDFIQSELESGKNLSVIGKENGTSREFIQYRAIKFGVYECKKQVRGAGKC